MSGVRCTDNPEEVSERVGELTDRLTVADVERSTIQDGTRRFEHTPGRAN